MAELFGGNAKRAKNKPPAGGGPGPKPPMMLSRLRGAFKFPEPRKGEERKVTAFLAPLRKLLQENPNAFASQMMQWEELHRNAQREWEKATGRSIRGEMDKDKVADLRPDERSAKLDELIQRLLKEWAS